MPIFVKIFEKFKLLFYLLVINQQEKVINVNSSSINSLTINGQTNLSFNLRPNKYIDRYANVLLFLISYYKYLLTKTNLGLAR